MSYALRRPANEQLVRMTIDDFLEFEERAPEKHFYIDGVAVAMSGGTYEQDTISTNLARHGGAALAGRPCRMQGSNIKVKLGLGDDLVFADGLIVCGEPRFLPHAKKRLVLLNPTVVFEVLSDSTREYDRSEKFDGYRSIESLQEYVLIEQEVPRVDVFRRMSDGVAWKMTPYASLDTVVKLESVGIELTMRQIYEGVRFGTLPRS